MKPAGDAPGRLLAVARDLFARHGYDAVSVRTLTARARVNLGAITYHFGSKRALYHATIASIAEPFAAAIAAAAATGGPALARVEAVVRAAIRHVSEQPGVPAIILRELATDRPLPPPMSRLMQRNIAVVASIIAAGQRDRTIREGDPVLLALSVFAQPFYFRVARRGIQQALGAHRRDAAMQARIVEHVVTAVRQSIARHPDR